MDENLIGYLLRALDPDENREVEAYLRKNPEGRARLEALQQGLTPLAADADLEEPPRTLALDTLARIAEYRCRTLPAAPRLSPQQVEVPARHWSRRADVIAAALLLILVGGLGAPLLVKQWYVYQRQACVQNLMTFWQALAGYSDQHECEFPVVQPQGPRSVAGIFVPVLVDAGMLNPEASVLCPAQGQQAPARYTTRELEEMFWKRRDEFYHVARDLGGSYAYTLGYREGENLRNIRGLRRDDGDMLPILADRLTSADQDKSPNHGGTGQNVLYIGGYVQWKTLRTVGMYNDDIYVNKNNKVSAGKDLFDSVLGTSDARPCLPE
jgi:hypothetical protein